METEQDIHTIAINYGWNTNIFQRMNDKNDVIFYFQGNMLNILITTVEVSHEWVL